MITKAKAVTFTSSDGQAHPTIESAKEMELTILAAGANNPLAAIVAKPREAIAILRFGLPRKPRATKPPMGRKPRRNLKREMPEIPGV